MFLTFFSSVMKSTPGFLYNLWFPGESAATFDRFWEAGITGRALVTGVHLFSNLAVNR